MKIKTTNFRPTGVLNAMRTFLWLSLCACCIPSCKSNIHKPDEVEKHWVEIRRKGVGMLYLDAVPNNVVMKEVSKDSLTQYHSFLVGFQDSSLLTDSKQALKKGVYFQYEMQKDWKLLVNGDSISAVFFQPKTKLYQQTDEGILVFELPAGEQPDTIVYRDTYGTWGVQQIVLKQQPN